MRGPQAGDVGCRSVVRRAALAGRIDAGLTIPHLDLKPWRQPFKLRIFARFGVGHFQPGETSVALCDLAQPHTGMDAFARGAAAIIHPDHLDFRSIVYGFTSIEVEVHRMKTVLSDGDDREAVGVLGRLQSRSTKRLARLRDGHARAYGTHRVGLNQASSVWSKRRAYQNDRDDH